MKRPSTQRSLAELVDQRRKRLDLYYAGGISQEAFADEEARITKQLQVVRA